MEPHVVPIEEQPGIAYQAGYDETDHRANERTALLAPPLPPPPPFVAVVEAQGLGVDVGIVLVCHSLIFDTWSF
jgi:hypothetical protein